MRKLAIVLAALCLLLLSAAQPACAERIAPPVRVGFFENPPFQSGAEPGAVRQGYAYEYYRKIAEYTGWQYEYVYGGFAELYQMLLDGKIDLLAGLAKTEDRQGLIGYPKFPMGSETYNIMKHNDDFQITTSYATLNGRRIGVLESAIVQALQKFLNEHHLEAEIATFPDNNSLMDAFDGGLVDAIVAESSGSYEGKNASMLYAFGSTDFYLCVNKERPDLLAELSAAQEQLLVEEPNFITSLKMEYDFVSRQLSDKEQLWLANHPTLRVGYLKNYLPYSAKDARGNVTGLIRDLIPLLMNTLRIENRSVSYTGYDSYDDMIHAMNEGTIDIAFPVGGGLYFSEENGIFQSNPVSSYGADLIFNDTYHRDSLQTIAVNRNNRIQYYYAKTYFPNAMLLFCPSIEDCLTAVSEGRATFTTLNSLRTTELLKNRKYHGLFTKSLSHPDHHAFGVSFGNEGLLKLLNRGLNIIGREQLDTLVHRHIDGVYNRSAYDVLLDNLGLIGLGIAAASLLVVTVFAMKSSHAKRRMKEKEEAGKVLEAKNRELDEHKQALIASNEKLAASAQREQAANLAKSQFVSNMSHEIRTPINAIMGMDELIRREATSPQILEYAENIRSAGANLLSLVNDILDFSKIEAGKMEIIPVEYETSSLLNDLVNLLKTRAEHKGLFLHLEASPELPRLLCGDEIRIKQVATNILTNAVKYTEKGGVTLRVSFLKKDDDNILLRFSVQDTGIGIKPEDIEKLFNPFERIEEKRNRTIEGVGLGMNITKHLLDLMESRLEVESIYGEGSTFSFIIQQRVMDWTPVGDIETAFHKSVASQSAYHERFTAPEAQVLVVDDIAMNITVLKGLLKSTEVQIDDAGSGADALVLTAKKKYDVIFLDHRMPDMDGVETLAAMRAQPEGKNTDTPVIALTANAISGARTWYLQQGFCDYLTKPVHWEHLEAAMIKHLPQELVTLSAETEPEPEAPAEGELLAASGLLASEEAKKRFDAGTGIMYCGGEKDYIDALRMFRESAAERLDEIRGYFDARDWKNYTTKVHALKSSARLVGALELSDYAKRLEAAGDRLDLEEIERDTPGLLSLYQECIDALPAPEAPEKDDADLPEIDAASLDEAYEAIREMATGFDYDSIQLVLEDVGQHRVPADRAERHARLVAAANKPDWDALNAILAE